MNKVLYVIFIIIMTERGWHVEWIHSSASRLHVVCMLFSPNSGNASTLTQNQWTSSVTTMFSTIFFYHNNIMNWSVTGCTYACVTTLVIHFNPDSNSAYSHVHDCWCLSITVMLSVHLLHVTSSLQMVLLLCLHASHRSFPTRLTACLTPTPR